MKQKKCIKRRRKPVSGTHLSVRFKTGAVVSLAAFTLCACIGVTVAFAGSGSSESSSFGLSTRPQDLDHSLMSVVIEATDEPRIQEESLLSNAAFRDITAGVTQIEEAEEAARLKAEEEAVAEKVAAEEAAKEKVRLEAEEEARLAEKAQAAEASANSQESSEGWQTGSASAYNIASSSTSTASGTALDETSLTVAVPASQSHLLGRSVEISWNGMSVVATVTDTGGFDAYGRALDLAPGVCKAFGVDTSGSASNCNKWGVQTVKYRFL